MRWVSCGLASARSQTCEGLTSRPQQKFCYVAGRLRDGLAAQNRSKAHKKSRRILSAKVIAIFESLHDRKKVAEAQTEIAVCYRREGALEEARVRFAEAMARLDDEDGDLKAITLLRTAVLEQLANRLNDALHILTTAATLFEGSTNQTLKGKFHNEFGMVLKDLGTAEQRQDYIDRALIEFAAASFYFEQAGHARYQACVENNLGFLFGTIGRFVEGHEHLDRAQALFTRLNDSVHLAQVEETRARVMLADGAVAKAEKIAKSAVQILERGGEQSLLAEALTTHGIALARLGNEAQARTVFERAFDVAEQAGDLESAGVAALTLFEQVAEQLSDDEICEILQRAHDLLQNTRNLAMRDRLSESCFRGLSLVHTFRPNWNTFSLEQKWLRHEARYIRMALEDAGEVSSRGVVSRAARLLSVSRQILHYVLKSRHKDLRGNLSRTTLNEQEADHDNAATRAPVEAESQQARTIKIVHVEDNSTVAEIVREITTCRRMGNGSVCGR